jgi:hypothetical protein
MTRSELLHVLQIEIRRYTGPANLRRGQEHLAHSISDGCPADHRRTSGYEHRGTDRQGRGRERLPIPHRSGKARGTTGVRSHRDRPVDKTELARHRAKLQAEDAVRSGDKFDLTGFSLRERKDIHANAKLTPLQARFSRLPMGDALQVWNAATRTEKTELRHELAKKRVSYLERANSNLSRDERQGDPVYGQVKALNLAEYARASEAMGEAQQPEFF